ncbi:glycosyltransferase family 2 protein [Hippea alviniae]|uniref:glycosyltransferase family 2 protein n=1 Tax=Hippea alviniae TaxID=1279027 RepID=UPI0003B5C6FD|nr:glycosyltransferase family 2 protein [Hippea alviniae]
MKSAKTETVCAVVVTYNRKELLIECLEALLKQTRPLDGIYIIDNASADGTPELLKEKRFIQELPPKELSEPWEKEFILTNQLSPSGNHQLPIHYVRMHENTGGAGGFHEGVKRAYEKGYDWLWLMDDDVEAIEDCLYYLLSYGKKSMILTPLRINKFSRIEEYNGIRLDLSNPFLRFNRLKIPIYELYENLEEAQQLEFIEVKDFSFEGPLINRKVVEVVGFPMKEFFIGGDDLEYSLRIKSKLSNVKFLCITRAVLVRKLSKLSSVSKRRKGLSWRDFYNFRNYTFIHKKYGNNFLVKLKPFFLFILISLKNFYNFKKVKLFSKALWEGYFKL